MAGAYPDAPSRRIAYDADGTVMWKALASTGTGHINYSPLHWGALQTITLTELTTTNKTFLNNEAAANSNGNSQQIGWRTNGRAFAVVWPEYRDIFGATFQITETGNNVTFSPRDIQSSANSTNGVDGDWNTIWSGSSWLGSNEVSGINSWTLIYRTTVQLIVPAEYGQLTRSFRFLAPYSVNLTASDSYLRNFHIYGLIPASQTPDRLMFIDNTTGLEFDKVHDWGDVPRGSTFDKEIKIRNNSTTLTANNNLLEFEDLTSDSNTWYTISDSGGAFGTTLNITSIPPDTNYPVGDTVTIRLTVAADESLSLQAARLKIGTGSWT